MSNIKNLHQYHEAALKFCSGEKRNKPITISHESSQWSLWLEYFSAKGFMPFILKEVIEGRMSSFTVPCNYPEMIDPHFR